jgi:hypothetical protein
MQELNTPSNLLLDLTLQVSLHAPILLQEFHFEVKFLAINGKS